MAEINLSQPKVELVKLEDGAIALRRTDQPDTPLVTIAFAEEALEFLQGAELDVARIMIQAGAQGYSAMQSAVLSEARQAAKLGRLH